MYYASSILSGLTSVRMQRVSPFYRTSPFADSDEIHFHVWFFLVLSDAIEASTSGFLLLHHEVKFIIGFDFAVTLSSPESYCVLLDITSEHSAELRWIMLNKHKGCFHSSRVKLPLVRMWASWFLVSLYLIWFLGSKLIRSKKEQHCGLWKHVSLSGFFPL